MVGHYEQVGVQHAVIVDTVAADGEAPPRLTGYRLVGRRFQSLAPDEHGRLWLEPVRLWPGLADNDIVRYDEVRRPRGG